MISRHAIESAYCFFHQKWRVYEYSTSEIQKEEIEYAISSYVENMSQRLYNEIACGKEDFLKDSATFATDMPLAVERLDALRE